MSNPDAIVAAPVLSRGGGRSVAMFVFNDVTHDRRVLMEADALQRAGWSVTIHGASADAREPGDVSVYPSGVRVIRHETSMPMLKIGSATLTTLVISVLWLVLGAFGYIARAAVPTFARRISSTQRLVAWATRAAAVATDDAVFHLHDLTGGLPLILSNRSVHRRVVYDSHEIFMESNALARSPRILRWAVANLFERRVVALADAFVTVNPAVQSELGRRYQLPEAQLVLYNCPHRAPQRHLRSERLSASTTMLSSCCITVAFRACGASRKSWRPPAIRGSPQRISSSWGTDRWPTSSTPWARPTHKSTVSLPYLQTN